MPINKAASEGTSATPAQGGPQGEGSAPGRTVTVIVVAYGPTPLLARCVSSLLASEAIAVSVVVVDNGSIDGTVTSLEPVPALRVLVAGENLGFAGGCNLGAGAATTDLIAFVNPDAVVGPRSLAALAAALADRRLGIVMARLRLLDEPDLLNSAGGAVHFLGMSWASGFRLPAATLRVRSPVAGASGAAMAMRREVFQELGGFAAPMFLYHEDLELSLRAWLRGFRVEIVPEADVWHDYDFSRHADKLYYLERNRWVVVCTVYERRTLLLLSPAILGLESGMFAVAALQGWLPQKLRAWRWLLRNRCWIRQHRRDTQSRRVISDRQLAPLIAGRFDAGQIGLPRALRPADWLLGQYWRLVRSLLR